MDPKLLPMIEQVCHAGPVARFQVRHVLASGESVVDTVVPDELAPEEIARRLWDSLDGDALMHDGPAVYWIVAYRSEGDANPIRRIGVKRNTDKLASPRLADNPLCKIIDVQAAQIESKDKDLLTAMAIIGRQATEGRDYALRLLERADRRIESLETRELNTVALFAELADTREARKIELEKEKRAAKLFGKIEDFGILLLGEAMGEKDGKLASVVERQIMQKFVDELSDDEITSIVERGEIKLPSDGKRVQLLRMLQPYLEESMRKKQAKAAEDAATAAAATAAGVTPSAELATANGSTSSSTPDVVVTTGDSIQ